MESKTQADMAAAPAQETHDCPAIAIENLSKFYGANQALCGISFAVQKGEINKQRYERYLEIIKILKKRRENKYD